MNSPLTALSERDRVCRMSNMVFSTQPLHNKWGKLRRENILLTLRMNLHFKQFIEAAVWSSEEMRVKLTFLPSQTNICRPPCESSCGCD